MSVSAGSGPTHPTRGEAFRVWIKIGLLSFGGPVGQIALMHQELVERRRWISDGRFLHALNYCMLLPGPEAQQLAIYTGWLLHRTWGGLVAGLMFVLPGAVLMWAISVVYVTCGEVPLLAALFEGLKPAVMAIVAAAVLRIGRKALKNAVMWTVAALAFLGLFVLGAPFPLIVVLAAVVGLVGGRVAPRQFNTISSHGSPPTSVGAQSGPVIDDAPPALSVQPLRVGRLLLTVVVWAGVWLAPLALCLGLLGAAHVWSQQGLFFSKAALLTFGGAYAVLPYVAQQAVETHGWLNTVQMMDGLALAETTPGPLILVLQFVGFLGGWTRGALGESPLAAATVSAFLTSWCTFMPGFLFIFAGAPLIERTRGQLRLQAVMSAVTAAVVGVVLNLSVWFAWHVIRPAPGVWAWFPLVMAVLFFAALQRWRWNTLHVVAAGGLLGVAMHALGWG